ncbi:5687_t:CDS:2, partial [Acaulospora morrowiae]
PPPGSEIIPSNQQLPPRPDVVVINSQSSSRASSPESISEGQLVPETQRVASFISLVEFIRRLMNVIPVCDEFVVGHTSGPDD